MPRGHHNRLGSAGRRTLAEDLFVEPPCLYLRLGAQLAAQHAKADLVLLQRGASPALPRIETH